MMAEYLYTNHPTKKRLDGVGYRCFLHRVIWEQEHGEIPKDHVIHHIDGNSLNNNIENLECVSIIEHGARHRAMHKGDLNAQF